MLKEARRLWVGDASPRFFYFKLKKMKYCVNNQTFRIKVSEKILDIQEGHLCVICGTLYKDMPLKVSSSSSSSSSFFLFSDKDTSLPSLMNIAKTLGRKRQHSMIKFGDQMIISFLKMNKLEFLFLRLFEFSFFYISLCITLSLRC